MFIAYIVVTIVTILANAAVSVGDFLRTESVLETSAELRCTLNGCRRWGRSRPPVP